MRGNDIIKQRYEALGRELRALTKTLVLSEPLSLLAVSKYANVAAVRQLYDLGQRAFGENYWQSAKEKQKALEDLKIEWHFIGSLQSNKCEEIAQHFAWVHSLAKMKHVALLAKARQSLPPLQICLQVNLSGDPQKYGVQPEKLKALAKEVLRYPSLHLRGLMVLPKPGETKDFAILANLRTQLEKELRLALPTLSMGMSEDYREAIAAGATIVRVGSLLFSEH